MVSSRTRLILPISVALAAAFVVAACGGAASPSPSPSPSAPAAVSPQPSVAASAPASAAPSAAPSAAASVEPSAAASPLASIPIPSLSADKNLESLLPSTFQGATLTKESVKLGSIPSGSGGSAEYQAIVSSLGVDPSSVTVAVAIDVTGKVKVTFLAVRFPGADSGKLQTVFTQVAQQAGTTTQLNLGGKSVTQVEKASSSGQGTYLYVKNDTILGVSAASDTDAGAALAVLP